MANSSSKIPKKQLLLVLGMIACLPLAYLAYKVSEPEFFKGGSTYIASQPKYQIAFSKVDAAQVCQEKAADEFGQSLVRAHVDWHSTRFERDRKLYLVVLKADVGNLRIFDKAFFYCYIDPDDYRVAYFKAMDAENRSINSRLSFRDLFNFN